MAIETNPRSRRALLAGAFAGLIAVVAQALRPLPVHAEGETMTVGGDYSTATTATGLKNQTNDNDVFRAQTTGKGRAIFADSNHGTALKASSRSGLGIAATSVETTAIEGQSTKNAGVVGVGATFGVFGSAEEGEGVRGSSARGTGVSGSSNLGVGISGTSTGGVAILGVSDTATYPSILGLKTIRTGSGVRGEIANATSPSHAVVATTLGTGAGLRAFSARGRGGVFAGNAAQLRLIPSAAATHPADGSTGDLFLDKSARLWLCTKSGSPAIWKQVSLV